MPNIQFANKGKTSAEIWLYDDVGEDMFGGISSKQFKTNLVALGRVDLINLRINSYGGSVFEGFAIFNALDQHPARIEVDIDGIAASIASVIAMVGDEIRIAQNAAIMIHDPYTQARGNAQKLRDAAEQLDMLKGKIVDTYERRTGLKNEEVAAMMSKETLMFDKQAIELGFADANSAQQAVAAHFDGSKPYNFHSLPQHLMRAANITNSIAQVKLVHMDSRIAKAVAR